MQIEVHPRFSQKGLRAFCKQQNIAVVAYGSLGCVALLSHNAVQQIAQQCGQTPAQVGLCKYTLPLRAALRLRALHPVAMRGSRTGFGACAPPTCTPEQRCTIGAAASMVSLNFKATERST